jgi:hypothetical protein
LAGTPAAEAGIAIPVLLEPVTAFVSIWPVPLYSEAKFLLLSAIQNGNPGAVTKPQGFDRLASIVVVVATTPTLFDTKAVSVNPLVVCWAI